MPASKWKPELIADMDAFFSVEPYEIIEVQRVNKKGEEYTTTELRANKLPFLSAWARKVGITTVTIEEWAKEEQAKKHPGFREAYLRAKQLQKEFLIHNALAGLYNPTSFIFTAKNMTDMRDVNTHEHGGEGGGSIPLMIIER